jgi:hypothetical protein
MEEEAKAGQSWHPPLLASAHSLGIAQLRHVPSRLDRRVGRQSLGTRSLYFWGGGFNNICFYCFANGWMITCPLI